jgi:hypothetical protein
MLFASGGRPPSPLVKGVDNSEADVRRWLHFGTSLWTGKFGGGAVLKVRDVPARGTLSRSYQRENAPRAWHLGKRSRAGRPEWRAK